MFIEIDDKYIIPQSISYISNLKNNLIINLIDGKTIEIGKKQLFEHTYFFDVHHLEVMISEYGCELNRLVGKNASMYLIHNSTNFILNHPKLWEALQNNFNAPVAFVFLTESQEAQIIPQIDTDKLCEATYDYLLESLKNGL